MRGFFQLFMAAAIVALAGCANVLPHSQPAVVVPAGPPLSAAEREFVTRVATRNVYEIEVSKLAADRAVSAAVRDYAQTMVSQSSRMNDELVALMSAHGVAPPKGLAADKATKLHRLASLPRSDAFDNGYIRVVGVEDHRKAIAQFEKFRAQAHDRDLRAWIDRSLAALRSQLTTAQSVAANVSG